jgi:MFS family permease
MLIPELPAYLTQLGGGEYKGLIISLFTVTALLSRPFSGKLADRLGRVPVIMTGSIVCLICSLIYPILTTVAGFLLLRLVHGFSTGFTPTGQAAYISDIIPFENRGEAMGYLGTAGTLGMAGGPAIGGFLSNIFGVNAVFYCSSAFALFSILIVFNIRETLQDKNRFHPRMLQITKDDLFEPKVLLPCITMLLTAYAYGTLLTIIPDFGEHVGIKNKGLLFTYFTLASFIVRLFGGKASDIYGRVPVLKVAAILIVSGMGIIATADTKLMLIIGVLIYGLGQGTASPTLLAWATDLSDHQNKGRGLASLYIFMELGIGVGALASGFIYGNHATNFFATFIVSSILSFIAFVILMLKNKWQAR